ncbi:MAG: DUF547 domain-containing protein [Chitinophagales bacterium]|jgi:hypothetical protein|nr:DUF547 domain-containing protein [Bacteroidota bacterium]MBP8917274.1 DUF547 domain-containing protein [Chitinophagales bacterium]MBP9221735.1 DUF547 domain-containing protein [Chitinophagales bacterium]MBP9796182.1 DUF547 domain-containing protein [Chitinophagales bacterium]
MKKTIFLLFCFCNVVLFAKSKSETPDTNISETIVYPTETLTDFFTSANSFFNKFIIDGKVNYTAIKNDPDSLQKLINFIGKADLTGADKNTATAFYINSYNLLVIKTVIDNLPLAKPTDITGFFDTKKHAVAGSYMTLNDLENKKLRPDPRVHFVLVCAAKGCPKIINEAYTPDKVQAQLDTQTKIAINDNSFIKIDEKTKTVKISKIFDWYKDDFIKTSGSAIIYINKYRTSAIPTNYTVSFYEYDWSLNGN